MVGRDKKLKTKSEILIRSFLYFLLFRRKNFPFLKSNNAPDKSPNWDRRDPREDGAVTGVRTERVPRSDSDENALVGNQGTPKVPVAGIMGSAGGAQHVPGDVQEPFKRVLTSIYGLDGQSRESKNGRQVLIRWHNYSESRHMSDSSRNHNRSLDVQRNSPQGFTEQEGLEDSDQGDVVLQVVRIKRSVDLNFPCVVEESSENSFLRSSTDCHLRGWTSQEDVGGGDNPIGGDDRSSADVDGVSAHRDNVGKVFDSRFGTVVNEGFVMQSWRNPHFLLRGDTENEDGQEQEERG